jgi:branched-chain amino acid transport system permease protein
MDIFIQLAITGVTVGSIYALVALGWTLIYKSSGVLNLAMGELTLFGAYVSYSFYQMGIPYPLALLLTLAVGIAVGFFLERFFLEPLIGESTLTVIMMTVGISFFLRGVIQFIWGTDLLVFSPPVFPSEPIRFGGIVLGQVYIWSFVAALALLVVFVLFFRYTRWGLAIQATADDEMAALSLGISAKLVYAIAWAIAFMAAGVGGSLLGNINGITVSVGYLGLLVLPAVVLGGLNSVPGAIVGGILIGLLQNFAGGYLDPLTVSGIKIFPGGIKDIFPFVVMTLALLVKPYGLFGWKRIERV